MKALSLMAKAFFRAHQFLASMSKIPATAVFQFAPFEQIPDLLLRMEIDPQETMNMLEDQLIHSFAVKTIVLDGAEHSFRGFEEQIVTAAEGFIRKGA